MITLKNLVKNSNFEQLKYNNDYSIGCANWNDIVTTKHSYSTEYNSITNRLDSVYTNNGILSSKYSYCGTQSLLITKGFSSIKSEPIEIISGHMYYLRCYTYSPTFSGNNKVEIRVYRHPDSLINLTFTDEWVGNTVIFTATQNTTTSAIQIKGNTDFENIDEFYIDSIMLIDLTEIFTKYGEPSFEWCNNYIPYFTSTFDINEKKVVKILNTEDFKQDKTTGLYYNNDNEIKIIFSIENFDIEYERNIDNEHKTRINLFESYKEDIQDIEDYDGVNRKLTQIFFGDNNFNEDNIISVQNKITVFEIKINCDLLSVGRQIQITGGDNIFGDTLITYSVFTWRNTSQYDIFKYSIDFGPGDYSAYKRIIKGETNPYIPSPTSIEILVNNTKVAGVKLNKNNYKNSTFEKELFLLDGNNTIVINAIDIFGNIIATGGTIINVDIMPIAPTKEDLLTNFIANDKEMIELDMHNIDLSYKDAHAGRSKVLDLDLSVTSHFFNLIGPNSQYYRISRDKLPLVLGDIIQRPISINFEGVEKVYDGTNDITYEMNKLKNNLSYKFMDIHEKYTSFLETGFVRGTYEHLYMQTILFNQYDEIPKQYAISSESIEYDSLVLNFDGYIGTPVIKNNIVSFKFDIIDSRDVQIMWINKDELISLLNEKNMLGLFYCIYEITSLNGNTVYVGTAVESYETINGSFELKQYDYIMQDNSEQSYNKLETRLKNWLKAIDNIIYGVQLYQNEQGNYILQFLLSDETLTYQVKDKVTIKYKYKNQITNDSVYQFKQSDEDKVSISFDNAYFDDKNVNNTWKPISFTNINLIGTSVSNDTYDDYQLANYSAYGRIIKRLVIPHIVCLDKVYDGSNYMPFTFNANYYNGIENTIDGDDVWIDNDYFGEPENNFHIVEKIGKSYLQTDTPDVGIKPIYTNSIILEGMDSSNYEIGTINFLSSKNNNDVILNGIKYVTASIQKRSIEVVIDKLRYVRSSKKWEVIYHFVNDIKSDNLTLSFNNNDNNDFKVYGGTYISSEESTISYEIYTLNDLSHIKDIPDMYFNYPYNSDYKFKEQDIEIYNAIDNKLYWINKARPAESNTLRIDIDIEKNNEYPGDIKLSKSDSPYYESENKNYRLYNNHTVKVLNLNLDPLNDKSKNYNLITTSLITTIEII